MRALQRLAAASVSGDLRPVHQMCQQADHLPIRHRCADAGGVQAGEFGAQRREGVRRLLPRVCLLPEGLLQGIEAEKGDPLGQMRISSRARAQNVHRDATSLLTACGLALRSFD